MNRRLLFLSHLFEETLNKTSLIDSHIYEVEGYIFEKDSQVFSLLNSFF